jgi:tetratricopeptide (TPR) repeat protein
MGWAVRDHAAREEGIERERLRQQAALDQKVDETLDTTGPLVDQGNWPEALAVVQRADNLLAAAGRTERPARLLELRRELTMAKRLEDIYRHPPLYLEASEAIVQDAGRMTVAVRRQHSGSEDDLFWNRQQDGIFAKAFRDFGIDIDVLAPGEAANRIKSRSIRVGLVKAVDEWVVARRRARGDNDPGWKKLVEIASLADPDPWRNRCREALLRRDRRALEELAGTVPVHQVPPATLWLLGLTLKEVGALDPAMALLRRAQQEYPTDLWINDTLGAFSWNDFHPPHTEDALRFYSIALSLRPTRPQLHTMVASILQRQKRLDEAVAYFRKAAELDPNAGAYNGLGCALYEQGELEESVACFRKAIELDPKFAQAYYNLGTALHSQGKLEEAIAEYRYAIELNPKHALAHNNLGNALRDKGQLDEAIAEYEKAIELNPKDPGFHSNLGRALRDKGKLEEAIACARKAIDLDPKNAATHNSLGLTLLTKGQQEEAIAEYRKAIELDPKFAPAHHNLGMALCQQGKLDEAIACLRTAIELDPKIIAAHNSLGQALAKKGKLEEAIACLRTAIELDPKFAGTHNNLGNALRDKGQLDEAIAEYRKAIELNPKEARAHSNLGNALRDKGKLEEAIACARKAIELDPKFAGAHYTLGNALYDRGQLDEAIAEYEKAIELDPRYSWAHSNLGRALLAKGKLEEAIACYRKAIELDPRCALDHNNLADVIVTYPDRKLGNAAEAVKLARKAVELAPAKSAYWTTLGAAHYRAGSWKEAVAALEKSMSLRNGGDGSEWFLLAMAHWQLGEKEKARTWFGRAVQWMDKNQPKKDALRRLRAEAAELMKIELKKE